MPRGKSSCKAADEAAQKTQIPLFGATVIGIMGFAGIGLGPDATGEFLFSLFAVMSMSLLLPSGLALTVAPLFGHSFFKQGGDGAPDAYGGPLLRVYGAILRVCLRIWWVVIPALLGLAVVCFALFGQVRQRTRTLPMGPRTTEKPTLHHRTPRQCAWP